MLAGTYSIVTGRICLVADSLGVFGTVQYRRGHVVWGTYSMNYFTYYEPNSLEINAQGSFRELLEPREPR